MQGRYAGQVETSDWGAWRLDSNFDSFTQHALLTAPGQMDLIGASYHIETPDQFWAELRDFVELPEPATLEEIDYALRSYLVFAAHFYDAFLQQEHALEHCLAILLHSRLARDHPSRLLDRIIHTILTEDDPSLLYLCLVILQHKGRAHQHVFRLLKQPRAPASASGTTPSSSVLLALIDMVDKYGPSSIGTSSDKEAKLAARERLGLGAIKLLYEVCRVSKLTQQELAFFNPTFVEHLFSLVESTRDTDEILNYTLVKLIIALNEQFMVSSLSPSENGKHGKMGASTDKNVVLQTIRSFMGSNKTFSENLIFILNRCDGSTEDLCVSLLILKILYLLFTTPGTKEYFYTNDLCVLVDVFLRELSDLPEENEGLRHTYLRVLHPLLNNTQLKDTPYKRVQIRRVLQGLISDSHRRTVNPTTKRLVERNLKSPWCIELGLNDPIGPHQPAKPGHKEVYNVTIGETVRRDSTLSTLSVDSVAAAQSTPSKSRKHQLFGHKGDLSLSPTSLTSSAVILDVHRPHSAASTSSAKSTGRRKPPEPPKKKKNVEESLPIRKRAGSDHASHSHHHPRRSADANAAHVLRQDPFLSPDKLSNGVYALEM